MAITVTVDPLALTFAPLDVVRPFVYVALEPATATPDAPSVAVVPGLLVPVGPAWADVDAPPLGYPTPPVWQAVEYADTLAQIWLAAYLPLQAFGLGPLPLADVLTIEVWAKREPGSTVPWLVFGAAPVHPWDTGLPFSDEEDGVEAGLAAYLPTDAIGSDLVIDDGAWHQYVAIVDAPHGTVDLYRDGAFVRIDALEVDLSAPAGDTLAWAAGDAWYLYAVGPVSRVAVYEGALSTWRIAWQYILLPTFVARAAALERPAVAFPVSGLPCAVLTNGLPVATLYQAEE